MMILVIRLFIIVVLTLLQFAAPLIHAHVSPSHAPESAIHLPEFEQVNAPCHALPALHQVIAQNDNTVVVSPGIKNERKIQQRLGAYSVLGALFFVLTLLFASYWRQPFAYDTVPLRAALTLSNTSPRAPPALR